MEIIVTIIFISYIVGKFINIRNKSKADAYLANKYDKEKRKRR